MNEGDKIFVKDCGKGIESSIAEKLFHSQITEVGTKHESGFGMGLYLVQNLLQKYAYRLSYQNNIPKGSIFILEKITNG